FDSPVGSISYLGYNWVDLNNDGLAQRNEVLLDQGVQYYAFVDPKNPAAVSAIPNRIDPNYKANHDNEAIVGLDHDLFATFAVSAAYAYRKGSDVTGWTPRIGASAADYIANAPLTARGFTARSFSPTAGLLAATQGGRLLTNRPDYSRSYNGVELTLMKRL